MDVAASLPLHSPLTLRCGRPRDSSSLSRSSLFSSSRGPYRMKLPSLNSSSTSALSCFSCLSREEHTTSTPWSWCCSSSSSEGQFIRRSTTSRYCRSRIVARSVLVAAAMADDDDDDDGYGYGDANPSSEVTVLAKMRGIGFYIVTSLAALVLIVQMLLQHPFVLATDQYRRKAHHFIANVWAGITITPFINIKFEGVENLPPSDTPAVYVSNHQSFLDIYVLLTLGRSFKFISKTAIFLYPVIGWAMSMLGTIPLERMDSRSQLECLRRCIDLVYEGASVFFFPEGTRSKNGKLGEFKKGAFSVAAKTGVPVVPMTLIGTGGIMPPGKEAILNLGSVRIIIHKPIQGTDASALCEEARALIAGPLKKKS